MTTRQIQHSVVRVGTSNNFNCTEEEFAQLDKFRDANPDKRFFVNSNVHTPCLDALQGPGYQAVITVNPELLVRGCDVDRAISLASYTSFCRVKWLPGDWQSYILCAIEKLLHHVPVVITMQRFNSLATLEKYTSKDYYAHECSRYRLHGQALRALEQYVDGQAAVGRKLFICDRKGLGCLGCGLCATLNGGTKDTKIESLNLSTSGVCPYSCPDCYAKTMQKFLVATGASPMKYDVIKANKKQSGKTKHIQHARKAAASKKGK